MKFQSIPVRLVKYQDYPSKTKLIHSPNSTMTPSLIFGSLDVTKQGNLVTGNGHAQRLLLEDCNIEENNPTGSSPEGLGADALGDAKRDVAGGTGASCPTRGDPD